MGRMIRRLASCGVLVMFAVGCSTGSYVVEHELDGPATEDDHHTVIIEEEPGEEVIVEQSSPGYASHGYSGLTECGTFFASGGERNLCQPGSFCQNATFSRCAQGCLSNRNCAPDQECVKEMGRDRGSCQAF